MSIKVKRSQAQPISRLMGKSGDIGKLMRLSKLIDQAQRHLQAHLPEEMRAHIYVGGFRDGRLTLISGQAQWLTWLRYEQNRLLGLIHQLPGFEGVTGFTFKVRPVHPVVAPKRNTRSLSADAGKTLAECAEDTTDPALKRALERLASHAPDA
ncbi:DciA family protein [Halomonas sp. CUBES01]|uniref:DciA family protein n=1 Tax=Vreelandella gomseomensis TaxID=370766 RepID=A0ABU1G8Y7_9GAMM|nr:MULTISPECIES: DciA family protein [Halomonas]MDR5873954.1 DciA family protein [Halomonas gomseomensis]MEC4767030.1 DciA family protein [Halomonas sp. CUBES01]